MLRTLFDSMSYGPAPEASDVAEAWLEDHGRSFGLFIDGKRVMPASKKSIEVRNPASGRRLAEVADASTADIDAAVKAARKAQKSWGKLSGYDRARRLYAIARAIQKHARLFAVVESIDNGKPIRESRDIDIPLVARHFYFHAGCAQLQDDLLPGMAPLGVIGQIIPWNFPLLMLAWKVAPALATGNTVVLKPAPYTPLTALLFADILQEAGLPAGVVNIVTGGDEAGAALVDHLDIDKIAFTGSTEVGRLIRQKTAGSGKKLSLELGGKSPFVVYDDADLDGAVEGLVDAIWFNQGQVCCAGSRLLVQENIADPFLNKLRRRMTTLRVGDSLDKGIDIGAVVDPIQRDTIDRWVRQGVADGAELFQPDIPMPAVGCFYPPTLLSNVSPASTVAREEIFGPVLVAMTFRTPAEAIALANNTRYGLAASVWSENITLALDTAHRVKAGSVWVNSTNLFDAAAGFGGYRESGYGREGGLEGLREYVRPAWQTHKKTASTATTNGADPAGRAWGAAVAGRPARAGSPAKAGATPAIDRTAKLYIGGKQARPDGAYSRAVLGPDGVLLGQVGEGNRKDIRNAVEAAHQARGWADRSPHHRAQVLFYLAENLAVRTDEFAGTLCAMTGCSEKEARREVDLSLQRLFTYAAWADKFGGSVQETTLQGFVVAQHESLGVIGIACPDERPLLAMVSLVAPAIARGNCVVVVPSPAHPLAATDFYQVLDTSDVPGGVVNIVTGDRDHLTKTLVEHDDVDAMWYFGDAEGSRQVEYRSAANMKRTWVSHVQPIDWTAKEQAEGPAFLYASLQVKNIWIPL